MVIIETRAFTARIRELASEETYRQVQLALTARPTAGDLIPGAGGLRKLRWSGSGRGKRGGIRVIYFWHASTDRLLMLFAFAKNERFDLTDEQKRQLRKIVETEYP